MFTGTTPDRLAWNVLIVGLALCVALVGAPLRGQAATTATISMSFQLRSTTCTKAVAQAPNGVTTITADGVIPYSLCIYVEDPSTGLPLDGAPVEVRTTVGTVGMSGTSRYSGFLFTTGGGLTSISYRGDGKSFGGDTAVASYAGGRAFAVETIELTPPAGRYPARVVVSPLDSALIAGNSTHPTAPYASPAPGLDVAVQVIDTGERGVNGQTLLVRSDSARLVANPAFGQTAAVACAGAGAPALILTTADTNRLTRSGVLMPGTANFSVCADSDRAPGEVVIRVESMTTALPTEELRGRHVGRPHTIGMQLDGTALTATVTDAGGQPVVDGTPVHLILPSAAGALSASCLTTRGGVVTATVALAMSPATVVASATYNERGAAASCAAPGSRHIATWLPISRPQP